MPRLFDNILDNIGAAGSLVERGPWAEDLPARLRHIKDFLNHGNEASSWYLWVALGIVWLVVFWLVLSYLKHTPAATGKGRADNNDPKKLFHDLLNGLELNDGDRKLLRRLAQQTRLKHPLMLLTSPGLLDWGRKLWLAEKGPRTVNAEAFGRIDSISVNLFDELTPSTNAGLAAQDAEQRPQPTPTPPPRIQTVASPRAQQSLQTAPVA